MQRPWYLALCAATALACGGRTPLLGGFPDAAASTDGATDAPCEEGGPSGGPCATLDGVRICGGVHNCPWLSPPICAGHGCTPAGDTDADAGVCWSDLTDKGSRLCDACNDGEVCIFRDATTLVCAPPDLCQLVWNDGDTTSCRYADKSAYTNEPLPEPSGACPDNLGAPSPRVLCGGACGDCGDPNVPCVGRSPGRPFGICPSLTYGPQPGVATCSIAPSNIRHCPNATDECAVFQVDSANQTLADEHGLCLWGPYCERAKAVYPGGLICHSP